MVVYSSFAFYLGGIAGEVDMILNYYVSECEMVERLDKNPKAVSFHIKNIPDFLKSD